MNNNKLVRWLVAGAIVVALLAAFVTGSAAWGAGVGTFVFVSARTLCTRWGA